MKIEDYKFGQMIVGGKIYTKDLIICEDKVKKNWWRKHGHILIIGDIKQVIETYHPTILVVGKGYLGMLNILPETKAYLNSNDIQLLAYRTTTAVEKFNSLSNKGVTMGAFHLTC